MRKCFSCGYRFYAGDRACEVCGARLSPLDRFRWWRRLRRLKERLWQLVTPRPPDR